MADTNHEFLWVAAGQMASFCGGFLTLKVITSSLGPERYGTVALGMAVAGFFVSLIYGPLTQIIMRFHAPCRERGELKEYLRVIARSALVSSTGVAVLVAGVGVVLAIASSAYCAFAMMSGLLGIALGLQSLATTLLMTMRERKWAALYQGLDPWIRVGFALLFIALFGAEGMAILAALILAAGVMAAGQFSFLLGRWQPLGRGLFEPLTAEVTRDLSRSFRNYSKPFVFFGILSALSLYSDRWILQWLLGKYEVGVYAALFQIASAPIAFVAGVVAQYLTPIVFERANKDRRADGSSAGQRLLSKSTLFTSVLLGLGVIAAVKLGQPLVGLLTNSEFARHGDLLWLFVLGWSFFQMAQLLVTHGLIAFRPDVYYVPKALQSLIFVFAGTGLAQWQGLQGMCWALCISSFMYFLSVVAVNKFVLKRPSVSTDIQ